MQIVIKIPDNMDLRNYDIPYDILNIITSGKALPKGHGRLIDADALIKGIEEYLIEDSEDREDDKQNQMVEWICTDVDDAPTIIEAESEE